MQKEHLSGQGKPWPDLLTRKKERGITKPHIKICDAVDKEEPMARKGMASVDSHPVSKVISFAVERAAGILILAM